MYPNPDPTAEGMNQSTLVKKLLTPGRARGFRAVSVEDTRWSKDRENFVASTCVLFATDPLYVPLP